MYLYYGIRALGVKTPQWVSKCITLTQITQFASLFFFMGVLIRKYVNDGPEGIGGCLIKFELMVLGTFIISTYLYLFCEYFHKTYIKNERLTKCNIIDNSEVELKKDKA
ncbi:hypothetical protein PMAYCL1PPCAC_16185, partial [Pristionchus mayeri]